MEARILPCLSLDAAEDFNTLFTSVNTLLLSHPSKPQPTKPFLKNRTTAFCSTSLSTQHPKPPTLKPSSRGADPQARTLLKSLSTLDRSLIGAAAGGIAGAFTYVCLLPIDAVKTKLQTKGAAQVYSGALDAAIQTFRSQGLLGFYRGVSAVLVGSASSSAVYFGTCELGKSLLSRLPTFPPVLVPPAAGAMGNIVSSAIMVPKELITQRMQAGAPGRSWEVLIRILEKDGILGLYAGYSATLLRNLPAGILSYSSFEYLKGFVLSRTGKGYLEPGQSLCCGALAGAISASLTTPLDVVKTRLMTQAHGEVGKNISETVRQILMEEGWAGLTRGIGPRVLHSACFAALGYSAFETARLAILHHYIQRRVEASVDEAICKDERVDHGDDPQSPRWGPADRQPQLLGEAPGALRHCHHQLLPQHPLHPARLPSPSSLYLIQISAFFSKTMAVIPSASESAGLCNKKRRNKGRIHVLGGWSHQEERLHRDQGKALQGYPQGMEYYFKSVNLASILSWKWENEKE